MGSVVPVATRTTEGMREKQNPPKDHEAMVTGVTAANVARATRGTCTRGRKDARAPGFVVAVWGMNQRIAASTTERTSNTTNTSCPGAGANVMRAPAPRVPAESPAKSVKLLRAGARSLSVSRITAAKVVIAKPVPNPCMAGATISAAARAGRYEEDHPQNVQRQSSQDRGAAPM
jgi:hypothetical protein